MDFSTRLDSATQQGVGPWPRVHKGPPRRMSNNHRNIPGHRRDIWDHTPLIPSRPSIQTQHMGREDQTDTQLPFKQLQCTWQPGSEQDRSQSNYCISIGQGCKNKMTCVQLVFMGVSSRGSCPPLAIPSETGSGCVFLCEINFIGCTKIIIILVHLFRVFAHLGNPSLREILQ